MDSRKNPKKRPAEKRKETIAKTAKTSNLFNNVKAYYGENTLNMLIAAANKPIPPSTPANSFTENDKALLKTIMLDDDFFSDFSARLAMRINKFPKTKKFIIVPITSYQYSVICQMAPEQRKFLGIIDYDPNFDSNFRIKVNHAVVDNWLTLAEKLQKEEPKIPFDVPPISTEEANVIPAFTKAIEPNEQQFLNTILEGKPLFGKSETNMMPSTQVDDDALITEKSPVPTFALYNEQQYLESLREDGMLFVETETVKPSNPADNAPKQQSVAGTANEKEQSLNSKLNQLRTKPMSEIIIGLNSLFGTTPVQPPKLNSVSVPDTPQIQTTSTSFFQRPDANAVANNAARPIPNPEELKKEDEERFWDELERDLGSCMP